MALRRSKMDSFRCCCCAIRLSMGLRCLFLDLFNRTTSLRRMFMQRPEFRFLPFLDSLDWVMLRRIKRGWTKVMLRGVRDGWPRGHRCLEAKRGQDYWVLQGKEGGDGV